MASAWDVPTIDISPYVTDSDPMARAEVAHEVDAANRTVGFMQITGHGITDEVIAGLGHAIDGFFALPMDEKVTYCTPPETNRGYSPPESESLARTIGIEQYAGANDYFEAFNVGVPGSAYPGLGLPPTFYPENLWPGNVDRFESDVTAYMVEAGRVARVLTSIFAGALGVDPGFFTSLTDHSVEVFRMNNYARPSGSEPLAPGAKGMGEHTDFGIVTVLWADAIPGLQILGLEGVWHDVLPRPGALLVNLGDLLARWTNDRWLSTLHRVVPPVIDGKVTRRRSAAFFHDGNLDAEIATFPSCLDPDGTTRYAPTTIQDHLNTKLGMAAGVLNTEAGFEAQRVRAAAG